MVEAEVGTGHGEVLAGAGRSGGGEERVGDPSFEPAALQPLFPHSSSFPTWSPCSISLMVDSAGSCAPAW